MPIVKKCDICGSTPTKLFSIDDVIQGCDAVICLADGLVFLSPAPTAKEILEYYSHGYDDDYRSEIKSSDTSVNSFRENFETSYRRFSKHLHVNTLSVLDIGAGMGLSLEVFRSHLPNSELYAVEASDYCRNHLTNSGVEVVSEDFFNEWQHGYAGKFDLIHLRHVFEHLIDPNKALQILSEAVKPDGLMYLCVPDMLNPMKPLKSFWFRAVHSHYFTIKTLAALLVANGFLVIEHGVDLPKHEIWVVCKKTSVVQKQERDSFLAYRIIRIILFTLLFETYKKLNLKLKSSIKKLIQASK